MGAVWILFLCHPCKYWYLNHQALVNKKCSSYWYFASYSFHWTFQRISNSRDKGEQILALNKNGVHFLDLITHVSFSFWLVFFKTHTNSRFSNDYADFWVLELRRRFRGTHSPRWYRRERSRPKTERCSSTWSAAISWCRRFLVYKLIRWAYFVYLRWEFRNSMLFGVILSHLMVWYEP